MASMHQSDIIYETVCIVRYNGSMVDYIVKHTVGEAVGYIISYTVYTLGYTVGYALD